jgi:hypothetical protein
MARKYTIEKVKNIFLEQGCKLLSREYKRVHDILDYECNCGIVSKISLSSFLNGCRCKECGNKKKGNNTKYSYEQVKNIFLEQNCELLSVEYKNARDILQYKCNCGRISKTRLTHFLRGHRCRSCGTKQTKGKLSFSYKEVKNTFKINGCELLSKKYKRSHDILDYRCFCGRKSKITFAHFLSGERCKKCGIEKLTGKNNPNYNPDLTDEDRINRRKIPENEIWRKAIYIKYDYTCQRCFQRGGKLNAHHIQNYSTNKELRFEENNGVILCEKCHKKFHKKYGNKNNTQQQLDKFVNLIIFV